MSFCDLPFIRYDIIGKMETFNLDTLYLKDKLKLNIDSAYKRYIFMILQGLSIEMYFLKLKF